MIYDIRFTKIAMKDVTKIKQANLNTKLKKLLNIIAENPYQNPPPFEKLGGELKEYYSRRINLQHRLVYMVDDIEKQIKVLSVWSHYERI